MKKSLTLILSIALLFVLSAAVSGVENKGPENLVLKGNKARDVPVSHFKHQKALGDCNACHVLFPQAAGSIDTLKSQGKLASKEVMKQCTSCHKERKAKAEPAGPTDCKGCHRP